MRFLALVNPASHNGATGRHLARLRARLARLDAEVFVSAAPGDLRRRLERGTSAQALLSVGGDGTLLEVLNSPGRGGLPLGVLPSGTGNSLAQDLGGTSAAQPRWVDLLKVELKFGEGHSQTWLAASTVADGYVARTVELANSRFKAWGPLCYPLASIAAGVPSPSRGVLLSNCRFAGNFQAFPHALIDDGAFDRMDFQAGLLKQTWHNLSVLTRLHFYNPAPLQRAAHHQGAAQGSLLTLDGEIFTGVEGWSVEVLPKAVQCFRI